MSSLLSQWRYIGVCALALFLITYCLVGSFTEVGITNVTPYLLELALAASLLVTTGTGRRPT